jgi:predicted O-methyltransferase YrrM
MTTPAFHEDWFSTESCDALKALIAEVVDVPGRIIEIGAWEGRSTIALANAAFPRQVDSCDTWRGSGHEISEAIAAERDVYAQWQANVNEWTAGNVTAHRMDWHEWLPTVADPVAFCFIDADHGEGGFPQDIAVWPDKMLPGGILALHDYDVWKPGVVVKQFTDAWQAQAQWQVLGRVGALIAFRRPER